MQSVGLSCLKLEYRIPVTKSRPKFRPTPDAPPPPVPLGILVAMAEHIRIRKVATRDGRPVMLDDGHVVEGDEVAPPTPGFPYLVRRSVIEHEDAQEVFNTSPVRAVITEDSGALTLLTDNSRYALEIVGR